MVETVAVPVQQQEYQEARDPNLCYWAEFYFLATMAHVYTEYRDHDTKPKLIIGATEVDGEMRECLILQKGNLSEVRRRDSDENFLIVKMGQPTGLVLSGPLADVIVIPENGIFVTGRECNIAAGRKFQGCLAEAGYKKSDQLKAVESNLYQLMSETNKHSWHELYDFLKTELINSQG